MEPRHENRREHLSLDPQTLFCRREDKDLAEHPSGQDALIVNALRDSRLLKRSSDMSDLFRLTDAQMAKFSPFFRKSDGEPRVDDRRVLSGIIFINRNGLR